MARRKYTGVRYARVPMGGETCPFCLMLASRGAVYTSSEAAGEMNHYHANCRCKVVPSWGLSEIEGYDPAVYFDQWKHPEKYAVEVGTTFTRLDIDAFPSGFTDTKAKRTRTELFVNGVNELGVADPRMARLYNELGDLMVIQGTGYDVKYATSGHKVSYLFMGTDGVVIKIPKMEGVDLRGQIVVTAHELGHVLDHLFDLNDFAKAKSTSPSGTTLKGVVMKLRLKVDDIADTFSKMFADAKDISEAIRSKHSDERKAKEADVEKRYIDKYLPMFGGDAVLAKKRMWLDKGYIKEMKAIMSDYYDAIDYDERNELFGIAPLQDMFDALSGGKFRDQGVVMYGHGSKYYSSVDKRCLELWANYCSLELTNPDLIELMRKYYPDVIGALDEIADGMIGEIDGWS